MTEKIHDGKNAKNLRVLSIQSHVVSGYVGNKCAVFPLQVLGFDVDFVNSVQFSNHTGYPKIRGQVLQDRDLEELYAGLEENDLVDYSHLLTGYVGSESFLRKIGTVVQSVKKRNPSCIYLCDPVLGDRGVFYVPESLIPIYQKEILPLADITTPNTFELELLSGQKITDEASALLAMDALHDIGVQIVALTSLDNQGNQLVTYVSQKHKGICNEGASPSRKAWKIVSERFLDEQFTGTGDLFAALFLAWYQRTNESIPDTLEHVVPTMDGILRRTKVKYNTLVEQLNSSIGITKANELELIRSLDIIQHPSSIKGQIRAKQILGNI